MLTTKTDQFSTTSLTVQTTLEEHIRSLYGMNNNSFDWFMYDKSYIEENKNNNDSITSWNNRKNQFEPILVQCLIAIPPENVRKPMVS